MWLADAQKAVHPSIASAVLMMPEFTGGACAIPSEARRASRRFSSVVAIDAQMRTHTTRTSGLYPVSSKITSGIFGAGVPPQLYTLDPALLGKNSNTFRPQDSRGAVRH